MPRYVLEAGDIVWLNWNPEDRFSLIDQFGQDSLDARSILSHFALSGERRQPLRVMAR